MHFERAHKSDVGGDSSNARGTETKRKSDTEKYKQQKETHFLTRHDIFIPSQTTSQLF